MHKMRAIAIDNPVAWASVSLSVSLSRWRLFLLIRQMVPLQCGHYYITVVTCFIAYHFCLYALQLFFSGLHSEMATTCCILRSRRAMFYITLLYYEFLYFTRIF